VYRGRRGAHYERLKTLALGDARFENASVGFDLATMSPTFRVHFGVPGSSSALAVARRYGIPGPTIARAERFLSVDTREFEREVRRLHEERRSLELAQAAAERARREAEARSQELIAEKERLRERGKTLLDQESEALLGAMRRAREELRAAQGKVRGLSASTKTDDREAREAQRIIDEIAAKLSVGGAFDRAPEIEEGPPLAPGALRRGLRVYVPRLRAEAEVVELLGDGQLRVAAGSLKMTLAARDVRGLTGEPRAPRETPRASKPPGPLAEAPLQTRDNTCDLRGMRVDDAVRMAEQFLDRSYSESRDVAFLLHGHGTGALREAVRTHLSQHSHVAQLRPGGNREGGEGVTVVWLR
jgi:DNA mismatch repair protein MutS2